MESSVFIKTDVPLFDKRYSSSLNKGTFNFFLSNVINVVESTVVDIELLGLTQQYQLECVGTSRHTFYL